MNLPSRIRFLLLFLPMVAMPWASWTGRAFADGYTARLFARFGRRASAAPAISSAVQSPSR